MDLSDVTCHDRVFSKTSYLEDQERWEANMYSVLPMSNVLQAFRLEGLGEGQLTSSKNV